MFFCHIAICSGQRTCCKYKCIVMLFFQYLYFIFWCIYQSYFGEFVRAVIFLILLPFCFVALNPSNYLPTSYLPTNLSIRSYLSKFFKAVPYVLSGHYNRTLYEKFLLHAITLPVLGVISPNMSIYITYKSLTFSCSEKSGKMS